MVASMVVMMVASMVASMVVRTVGQRAAMAEQTVVTTAV